MRRWEGWDNASRAPKKNALKIAIDNNIEENIKVIIKNINDVLLAPFKEK